MTSGEPSLLGDMEEAEPLSVPCPPSPVLGSALSGVYVEKKIVREEDAGLRPRRFKPPEAFEAAMQGEERAREGRSGGQMHAACWLAYR